MPVLPGEKHVIWGRGKGCDLGWREGLPSAGAVGALPENVITVPGVIMNRRQ